VGAARQEVIGCLVSNGEKQTSRINAGAELKMIKRLGAAKKLLTGWNDYVENDPPKVLYHRAVLLEKI